MSENINRLRACASCGAKNVELVARDLCEKCYRWHTRNGTLHNYSVLSNKSLRKKRQTETLRALEEGRPINSTQIDLISVETKCYLCNGSITVQVWPGTKTPKKICRHCYRRVNNDEQITVTNEERKNITKLAQETTIPNILKAHPIKTFTPGDPEFEEISKQCTPIEKIPGCYSGKKKVMDSIQEGKRPKIPLLF